MKFGFSKVKRQFADSGDDNLYAADADSKRLRQCETPGEIYTVSESNTGKSES
jgi:hypothetical protein